MNQPEIVCHDVLQSRHFSDSQNKAFAIRSPFEWFCLATKDLQDYPLVLAVVAEGVDENIEWVNCIKKHPNWKVECHGWIHRDYRKISLDEGMKELIKAKYKIESTFDQKVTRFFPPKLQINERTLELCRIVSLKQDETSSLSYDWVKDKTIPSFYFHYWAKWDLKKMEEVRQALAERQ